MDKIEFKETKTLFGMMNLRSAERFKIANILGHDYLYDVYNDKIVDHWTNCECKK